MFTATSALCVTGLTVVDTGTHWSALGETVILGLIQVGGIGVMTLASLIVLLIGGRLGVRTSLLSEAEARGHRQMSARDVVVGVVRTSLIFEALVASALTARFMIGYGEPPLRALYDGVFHSISAFNNAGFGLRPDNMESWVTDPWVCLPVAAAVISGGLGFPVLWELRRRWATPGRWSLHTRITVTWSAILLVGGTLVVLVIEWAEPLTLGGLNAPGRVLAAFFHSTVARTAGFNTLPIGDLQPETLLTTDALMFIGGGSAGTAGGIKVTTFVLLAFIMWAELRGETSVAVWRRRLPQDVQRQALTIALSGVGVVMGGTWLLLSISHLPLQEVLFEVVSASATVGLTTGITPGLPDAGKLLLVALMFFGRLGPITLGAALALRSRPRRYEFPDERPIVG